MKRDRAQGQSRNNNKDRDLQAKRRARVPEIRRLVEEVAPAILESSSKGRIDAVPEWKAIVSAMQADVHTAAAEKPESDKLTEHERRGYEWHFKVHRVAAMLEYLMQSIRDDLGFDEGSGTLATMVLVRRALLHLALELQDGGSEDGRDDAEENRYRVYKALMALTPRFDDVHMRRFRALLVANFAAGWTKTPDDEEIERLLADLDVEYRRTPEELERDREYMRVDRPVVDGVFTRDLLAEVDPLFRQVDPLVVLEEFSEAKKGQGGRTENGEGRTGPARAVARLAIMCGALEYRQEEDEDFDGAVERVRGNLLMTRSRFVKTLREFPGQVP